MLDWLQAGVSIANCQSTSTLAPLETRILLMHALNLSRVQLITQSDYRLSADQATMFASLLHRRIQGEPIAYIIGEREFFGLPFHVTPDVLIPRPDTELLVELAIHNAPPNSRLLDLGTGSGAIAVAVAHQRHDLDITAADISPEALAIAQTNAHRNLSTAHAARLTWRQSDWYSALPDDSFDIIVSNPPYIINGDVHLSEGDLRFEPINALTDHADGLSAYRTIIAGAPSRLSHHGWLLLEHGYDQAESVRSLLIKHGFINVQSWNDLAGIARVSGAQRL